MEQLICERLAPIKEKWHVATSKVSWQLPNQLTGRLTSRSAAGHRSSAKLMLLTSSSPARLFIVINALFSANVSAHCKHCWAGFVRPGGHC